MMVYIRLSARLISRHGIILQFTLMADGLSTKTRQRPDMRIQKHRKVSSAGSI